MLTVLTGVLAGLVHVLSGPDHLTAVAPLALDDERRGWLSGWTWSVGHSSGVGIVAVTAVVLRDSLPAIALISAWSERLVGVTLMGIGLWALQRSIRSQPSAHSRRAPASFLVGMLHGAAGSSHLAGVLPALALPSPAAFAYLGGFGIGSLVGMTAFAAFICLPHRRVPHASVQRAMMFTAAMLALVTGGYWTIAGFEDL